jgi:hypothetical protein
VLTTGHPWSVLIGRIVGPVITASARHAGSGPVDGGGRSDVVVTA